MIFINTVWTAGIFIVSIGIALFQGGILVAPVVAVVATAFFIYMLKKGEVIIKEIPGYAGATFCMIMGHFGTLSLFYIYSLMEVGGASGLFFIPSVLWMGIWYLLAIATIVLSSIFQKETTKVVAATTIDQPATPRLIKEEI